MSIHHGNTFGSLSLVNVLVFGVQHEMSDLVEFNQSPKVPKYMEGVALSI